MLSYAFVWFLMISMNSDAFQWFPMLSYGSYVLYNLLCFPMISYGFWWFPNMVSYDSLWFAMIYDAFLCFCAPSCSFLCFPMFLVVSNDFLGFYGFPMLPPDFKWFSVLPYAVRYFPMTSDAFLLCFPMFSYALFWFPMLSYAFLCFLRFLLILYNFLWFLMTSYAFLCFSIVSHGFWRFTLFFYDFICFPMPPYGFLCFPMLLSMLFYHFLWFPKLSYKLSHNSSSENGRRIAQHTATVDQSSSEQWKPRLSVFVVPAFSKG